MFSTATPATLAPAPCSPAGPTRSLLTWARLPLPLLYEGSQVRLSSLPAALPAALLALQPRQPPVLLATVPSFLPCMHAAAWH
jgi:hypothetical protein